MQKKKSLGLLLSQGFVNVAPNATFSWIGLVVHRMLTIERQGLTNRDATHVADLDKQVPLPLTSPTYLVLPEFAMGE